MKEKKYTRKRKATPLQIKTLHVLNSNPGMGVSTAMRQAGYSIQTAKGKSTAFFKSPTVQKTLMTMKKHLEDEEITGVYMAQKFKEWIDAQKLVKDLSGQVVDKEPDYDTQIKGAKLMFDRIDKEESQNDPKLKRKMTIEEFVGDEAPVALEESK